MSSEGTCNILSDNDEDLRPRQQSLGGVLRREGNWKCFLLTLMIGGCLASVAWCTAAEVDRDFIDLKSYPIKRTVRESPCEVGYAYIPIAFVLLLYLVYLVECYHSTARIQLSRRQELAAVAARVQAMRDATPRVWWKAICYHYVRRKRQVTRYRNGDAYTTTQVYYERVNTHSASTTFAHACCGQRDASRTLRLDTRPPITKLRFSKGFAFANIEAASEFEEQRSRFFAEHERFDDFMEMREGLDLVGLSSFKEYMVAYRDADSTAWYSSQLLFWFLSCVLLSWPLRIAIECNTAYVHYTITKIFGTNYELDASRRLDLETHLAEHTPPVTASNYGWTLNADQTAVMSAAGAAPAHPRRADPVLSHATTIDSLELFAAIRENCALVPSYSEAMRIEDAIAQRETLHAPAPPPSPPSTPRRAPVKAVSLDEPPAPVRRPIATAHSSYTIAVGTPPTASSAQPNRRSWAGMLSGGCSARHLVEELRSLASSGQVAYESVPEPREAAEGGVLYSSPLSRVCARDPFGGRAQTTPTEEPPPEYEEALRLPTLRRSRPARSASGGELAANGARRAFLLDTVANRHSGVEGTGVLSEAYAVRLLGSDPLHETKL